MVARMRSIPFFAALPVVLCAAAASAQGFGDPLVFEGGTPVPLEGGEAAENARAGDAFLVPFALRNRSPDDVWLRRIVLRVPDGMEIVPPVLDRIDNDRDGMVDEADEAFDGVEPHAKAWLGDPRDEPLSAGSAVERAVKLRLLPDMEAGASATLDIVAAASDGDLSLRARLPIEFELRAPTLGVTLDGSTETLILLPNDRPKLRTVLAVPSGGIEELTLALAGNPAVGGFVDLAAGAGVGMDCGEVAAPQISTEGRIATAHFGTCRADLSRPETERVVWLEGQLRLSDADAFDDLDVIRASRIVRVDASASRGTAPVALPMSVAARIAGPLIGGTLLEATTDPVDAGDVLSLKLQVVNRGDADTRNLTLRLMDDGAIDCASVRLHDGGQVRDACSDGLALQELPPGASQDIGFTVALRDDAAFRGEVGLRMMLSADNIEDAPLPRLPYRLRLPDPPMLRIGEDSQWRDVDGIPTVRIGDLGVVEISGSLPEGVYPARLRILARSVDAQTGEPVGPAPIVAKSLRLQSPALEFTIDSAPVMTIEDGWTVIAAPSTRMAVPVDPQPEAHAFTGVARLLLRDVEEAQAGRVVEITAKLDLFDAETVGGDSWVEALIVEPEIELTVRSTDADRSIEFGETVEIASIACNRGLAAAHGFIMRTSIPSSLAVTDIERARFFLLPAVSAHSAEAVFSSDAKPVGKIAASSDNAIVRGVFVDGLTLDPGLCATLALPVRRTGSSIPEDSSHAAVIETAIEPFKGREGIDGRLYPGVEGRELRFVLPPLRFGPPSDRDVGAEDMIVHEVSLGLPGAPGFYRVALVPDSAEGLDWTILRIGEDGAATPWQNGTEVRGAQDLRFRLEARNEGDLPLGWIDTTILRAAIFSENADPVAVSTRLVSRREEAPGGSISVIKTLALDRDCDGDVGDERVQDALFEPVKDAAIGDCVIFRVAFRHSGNREMERIVVRDSVPDGTELRADAVEVIRAPEPLQNVQVLPPKDGERDMVWRFDGLFKPGVEGEVSYAVKLVGDGEGAVPQ